MKRSECCTTEVSGRERLGAGSVRWWPAVLLLIGSLGLILWLRSREEVPFQQRNTQTLAVLLSCGVLLMVWWLGFSRVAWRLRWVVAGCVAVVLAVLVGSFRITGVTGDLIPILEPRWGRSAVEREGAAPGAASVDAPRLAGHLDFPQFLGPERTGILPGPRLEGDWSRHPPVVVWRRPVGAGWSGFAIVGDRVLTQEQFGEEERVTCYQAADGRLLWSHAYRARYAATIAGEGPRATPTVAGDRVYTLGATGILNCLEFKSGELIWSRDIAEEAGTQPPEWGYSGSPLVLDGMVVVSAGGGSGRSVMAYEAGSGLLVWSGGDGKAGYSSPLAVELAGTRQILVFNARALAAHAIGDGRLLWEQPFGRGHPHVAMPVVVSPNEVLVSSGYGVGSELLAVEERSDGTLGATQVWRSLRMKAKFSNPVKHEGYLYGLDDGMLACVDLKDGAQRWKEGRYGHGQGLLVNGMLLLMSESGELVLLRPTPEAPNELARHRVFQRKTWNPIALAGDLLLVRNDLEAAAVRLATVGSTGDGEAPGSAGGRAGQ